MAARRLAAGTAALLTAAGCASSAAPSGAAYVGCRWRVVAAHDPQGRFPVPSHTPAPVFLAFGPAGDLEAADGGERYHLRYRLVRGGYSVTGYRGSFGWYTTKAQERLSDAVTQTFLGAVRARTARARLRVSAGGYGLVCVRSGRAGPGGDRSTPSAATSSPGR